MEHRFTVLEQGQATIIDTLDGIGRKLDGGVVALNTHTGQDDIRFAKLEHQTAETLRIVTSIQDTGSATAVKAAADVATAIASTSAIDARVKKLEEWQRAKQGAIQITQVLLSGFDKIAIRLVSFSGGVWVIFQIGHAVGAW